MRRSKVSFSAGLDRCRVNPHVAVNRRKLPREQSETRLVHPQGVV